MQHHGCHQPPAPPTRPPASPAPPSERDQSPESGSRAAARSSRTRRAASTSTAWPGCGTSTSATAGASWRDAAHDQMSHARVPLVVRRGDQPSGHRAGREAERARLSVDQHVLLHERRRRSHRDRRSRPRASTGRRVGKPDKIKVISRHRAYHGLTLAAMSATGLAGVLADVRAAHAGLSPHRRAGSVSLRRTTITRQPRCRGGQPSSKRPSCAKAPTRSPRSSPSPCRAPAASSSRRRLLPAHPRDLRSLRRAVHRRRGDHRLRPHRPVVRPRALRRRTRHHAVRQGHHQRLRAARRHRRLGRDSRRHQRRAAGASDGCTPTPTPAIRPAAPWRSRTSRSSSDEGLVERAAAAARASPTACERSSRWTGVGHVRALGLIGAVEVVADKTTKALHPAEARPDAAADRRAARTRALHARGDGLHLPRAAAHDRGRAIDRLVQIVGETIPAVLASVGQGADVSHR